MSFEETKGFPPFILKDLPDDNGVRAEVEVTPGFYEVQSIKNAKSNARVELLASNLKKNGRLIPVAGYVPIESETYKMLEEALNEKKNIYVRIERVRKPGVDRSIPIQELKDTMEKARDNIFKHITGCKWKNEDGWVTNQKISTLVEEEKKWRPGGLVSTYNLSPEEKEKILNSGKGSKSSEQVETTTWDGAEGQPWKKNNPDGSFNAGSHYVSAISSCLWIAGEINTKFELDLDNSAIQELAKYIFESANKMQKDIYKLQKSEIVPTPADSSHVRARGFINEAIRQSPYNKDSGEKLSEWLKKIMEESYNSWKFCMAVISKM